MLVLGTVVKNLPVNAGDTRDACLIPGLGRFPGQWHGNPLQYACLGNPMDRGELVRLYSLWGRKRVRHDLVTKQHKVMQLVILFFSYSFGFVLSLFFLNNPTKKCLLLFQIRPKMLYRINIFHWMFLLVFSEWDSRVSSFLMHFTCWFPVSSFEGGSRVCFFSGRNHAPASELWFPGPTWALMESTHCWDHIPLKITKWGLCFPWLIFISENHWQWFHWDPESKRVEKRYLWHLVLFPGELASA